METLSPSPDGDQNKASALLGIVWVFYAFALSVMLARIFVRFRLKNHGIDDYLMALTTVKPTYVKEHGIY